MLDRQSFESVRIWAYNQRGLGRKPLHKVIRRALARTTIHRAWLQGWTGSFLVSVLDREVDPKATACI
jgi:hypothetical protein